MVVQALGGASVVGGSSNCSWHSLDNYNTMYIMMPTM